MKGPGQMSGAPFRMILLFLLCEYEALRAHVGLAEPECLWGNPGREHPAFCTDVFIGDLHHFTGVIQGHDVAWPVRSEELLVLPVLREKLVNDPGRAVDVASCERGLLHLWDIGDDRADVFCGYDVDIVHAGRRSDNGTNTLLVIEIPLTD